MNKAGWKLKELNEEPQFLGAQFALKNKSKQNTLIRSSSPMTSWRRAGLQRPTSPVHSNLQPVIRYPRIQLNSLRK